MLFRSRILCLRICENHRNLRIKTPLFSFQWSSPLRLPFYCCLRRDSLSLFLGCLSPQQTSETEKPGPATTDDRSRLISIPPRSGCLRLGKPPRLVLCNFRTNFFPFLCSDSGPTKIYLLQDCVAALALDRIRLSCRSTPTDQHCMKEAG